MKAISLIEGKGTGRKVSEVFKKVVSTIYKKELNRDVDFLSFSEMFKYSPNTYISIQKEYKGKKHAVLKKDIKREVKDLKKFYLLSQEKSLGLFRTAINAQTLYYLRREIKKIKLCVLPVKINNRTKRIIFIRDQMQGYYINENEKLQKGLIKGQFQYSEANFLILTRFIKKYVKQFQLNGYDLHFVYKYHLFGLELYDMISDAIKEAGLRNFSNFDVFQPDTFFHKIFHEMVISKNCNDLIIVAGNEIGDTFLEAFIHFFKLGTKETVFTVNVAFTGMEKSLEVLQTMHGSADDISGTGLLNPIATIKAASFALENWLKVPDAQKRMETVIEKAVKQKFVTKDLGGSRKTDQVVEYVLNNWK